MGRAVIACYSPVSSTRTTAANDGPGWSAATTAFVDHWPAAPMPTMAMSTGLWAWANRDR